MKRLDEVCPRIQGGIPNVALSQGGAIMSFRVERTRGEAVTWIAGMLTVVGAIVNCSGVYIFVVLVPLLLAAICLMMLGPLGLGLAAHWQVIFGILIGLFAAKGTSELTNSRCS